VTSFGILSSISQLWYSNTNLNAEHRFKSPDLRIIMDPNLYLVRLAQVHSSFRKPELESLALNAGVDVDFVQYSEYVGLISHSTSRPPLCGFNIQQGREA